MDMFMSLPSGYQTWKFKIPYKRRFQWEMCPHLSRNFRCHVWLDGRGQLSLKQCGEPKNSVQDRPYIIYPLSLFLWGDHWPTTISVRLWLVLLYCLRVGSVWPSSSPGGAKPRRLLQSGGSQKIPTSAVKQSAFPWRGLIWFDALGGFTFSRTGWMS